MISHRNPGSSWEVCKPSILRLVLQVITAKPNSVIRHGHSLSARAFPNSLFPVRLLGGSCFAPCFCDQRYRCNSCTAGCRRHQSAVVRQVWTSSIADKTSQLTDSLIFAMSFNCFGDWNLTRSSFALLSSVTRWIYWKWSGRVDLNHRPPGPELVWTKPNPLN